MPLKNNQQSIHKPQLIVSDADLATTVTTEVYDQHGDPLMIEITCERRLTLYLNSQEIVSLMTLGSNATMLVLGYLKNQGFITQLEAIDSVIIDWDTGSALVTTRQDINHVPQLLTKKTVTSGCGQGTMFGQIVDHLSALPDRPQRLKQSQIYAHLDGLMDFNKTYKKSGAVHGCAIGLDGKVLAFVEDVGRHNAVDTLAGILWYQSAELKQTEQAQMIFYTTGRLTSEMVIKVAQMGIHVLISRSGVTQMGYELAKRFNIITIARAKGTRFEIYHGRDQIIFDYKFEQNSPPLCSLFK